MNAKQFVLELGMPLFSGAWTGNGWNSAQSNVTTFPSPSSATLAGQKFLFTYGT